MKPANLNRSPPSFKEGVLKEDLELRGTRARAYQFAGGAHDPHRAVVCLAGMGANGRSFARQRPLAESWFVLPLNTPTETPAGADPLEFNVEVVEEFIEAEGLQRPVLLGSSFGGAVAAALALRKPGKFRALVLANAALSRKLVPLAFPGFIDLMEAPEPLAWLVAPVAVDIMGGLRLDKDARQEIVKESRAFPTAELKRRLGTLFGLDLLPRLPELALPTLWVHGTRDWLVPWRRARKAAELIPGAKFALLKGAGHLPYLSHPEAFNAAVAGFLSELEG